MVALGDKTVDATADAQPAEPLTEEEELKLEKAKKAEAKAIRVSKAEAMLAESLAADYHSMSDAEWVAPETRRQSVILNRIEGSIRHCKCCALAQPAAVPWAPIVVLNPPPLYYVSSLRADNLLRGLGNDKGSLRGLDLAG